MVIGAALCSPIAATFALIGSAVGMAVAFAVGASTDEIYAGLWGYNPVLGSIAIGGMFYVLDLKTTILAVMCGVLCSLLFGAVKVAFAVWAIPAATLPFVLSAWVFVLLQGSISRVFPVKLTKITTPEGHLRKHIGKIQKVLLAQSQSRESESSDIPLADIP
jgi:urea transporter